MFTLISIILLVIVFGYVYLWGTGLTTVTQVNKTKTGELIGGGAIGDRTTLEQANINRAKQGLEKI